MKFNEYDQLVSVAVREPLAAFATEERIHRDWQRLRFHSAPRLEEAVREHEAFCRVLREHGAEVTYLGDDAELTLDSIYPRDSMLVTPRGLILCHMGRSTRRAEPEINARQLTQGGKQHEVAGVIEPPGTIEGGDVIWLNERSLAVGLGPRTNRQGIEQLSAILGPGVEVHVVPLPEPDHPEDVFHLMSMISPLDEELALVYRPLMPSTFIDWLQAKGFRFIEVPEEEFPSMGCNVLATGPRRVIMLDGLPVTASRLESEGCLVTRMKGEEISRKGEGGPTCLTRPLVRHAT